jgi:hypothetical protein
METNTTAVTPTGRKLRHPPMAGKDPAYDRKHSDGHGEGPEDAVENSDKTSQLLRVRSRITEKGQVVNYVGKKYADQN